MFVQQIFLGGKALSKKSAGHGIKNKLAYKVSN
jgi:hypothetical protein